MTATRYAIPQLAVGAVHRTMTEVRRSRFITSIGYANEVDVARQFIEAIKQEFPDATHNCWAFAVGPPGDTARIGFSDDGEPHGTAGRPMLHMLLHSNVGALVCVVTRYFGGVKLGAGGLVRAYQGAVRECLDTLVLREHVIRVQVQIVIDYTHIDKVRRLFPQYEVQIVREDFGVDATYLLSLPSEMCAAFIRSLTEATDGCALIDSATEE